MRPLAQQASGIPFSSGRGEGTLLNVLPMVSQALAGPGVSTVGSHGTNLYHWGGLGLSESFRAGGLLRTEAVFSDRMDSWL